MEHQHIAVIGSGISGLTAAYLLSGQHQVTLFEANNYLGGHTHTVPVSMAGQELAVDTGFIVCNDRNYPNFMQLMDRVGVELQASQMSFSVRNPALDLEYCGHTLDTLFAQRRNLLSPRFYALIRDILRFNRAAIALADSEDGKQTKLTLDDLIARLGLGTTFRDNYLLPMVAAIWSCSLSQAGDFPLSFFLRFFLNHGLLQLRNRPQWYVLKGGSHSYIKPLTQELGGRIHLQTPVDSVRRTDKGVAVNFLGRSQSFDHVVMACHSNQSLAILESPSVKETEILSAIGYQENDVILHSDASLMPRRPKAWASWNFLAGDRAADALPVVTYSMNILQSLESPKPLLVSLNARDKIDPETILGEYRYAHPVYSLAAVQAQQQRNAICGTDRIHYCGAYWYNGFHEDGVKSALDVTQRFGVGL